VSGIYGKGPKAKATQLHSLVVRTRGACERCGASDYARLQCAHIVPRRYTATRTDETAAWCLCAGCHLTTTEHAHEHMELVDRTIGRERYDELVARARAGMRSNEAYWRSEVHRLQVMFNRIMADREEVF
jgi:hypothetical protein